MTVLFTVSGLLLQEILGAGTWAGMATTAITLGSAVSATALASYMGRNGRRPGLVLGYMAAVIGAFLAIIGAQVALETGAAAMAILLLVGLLLMGVGQGATNLSRYAGADLALPEKRSQAISLIVFGSTAGAVGGPLLVDLANRVGDALGLAENVGPFVFTLLFFVLAGGVVFGGLRPDPLVVSGGLHDASTGKQHNWRQGFAFIFAHPLAIVAMASLVISQAVMVMVMAMTPLHMEAHGHEINMVGAVISVHTAGMFAFAPLAGWVSSRVGRLPTLVMAAMILIVATIIAALAAEATTWMMFAGLYLLGLGWSFGVVAGSALLTESVKPDQQVAAQGSADLLTNLASGTGALASGIVFEEAGFHVLAMIGIAASGAMLVLTFYRYRVGTATLAKS